MRFWLVATFLSALPLAALAAHDSSAHHELRCLEAKLPPSAIPSTLPVGVETIHRDSEKIITIFVPLAPAGNASRVLDTNAREPRDRATRRFVISDGTVRTAFIGVDLTAGSRLDSCVSEIVSHLPSQAPKDVFEFIRSKLQNFYLREPPHGMILPLDRGRKAQSAELTELFHAAKDMPVGQYPLRSRELHDVVPLERFLQEGYGTCLHKALLASAILGKLGIPHRMVNGATRANGHTWIELEDGRILDPSLQKLESPHAAASLPGWIVYGDTFVFENQVWPFLALD